MAWVSDLWRGSGKGRSAGSRAKRQFIQGVTFERRAWSSQKPDWDHDHGEPGRGVDLEDLVFSDDADTQLEG